MSILNIRPLPTSSISTSVALTTAPTNALHWTTIPTEASPNAHSGQAPTYIYQTKITPEVAFKEFGFVISAERELHSKVANPDRVYIRQVLRGVVAHQQAVFEYIKGLAAANKAAKKFNEINSNHNPNDQRSVDLLSKARARWQAKNTQCNRTFAKNYVVIVWRQATEAYHGIRCSSLHCWTSLSLNPTHISLLKPEERLFLLKSKIVIESSPTLTNLIRSRLTPIEKEALYQGSYYLFGANAKALIESQALKDAPEQKA